VTINARRQGRRLTQSIDVCSGAYVVTAGSRADRTDCLPPDRVLDGGNEIKTMPRIDSARSGTEWTPVT